MVDGIEVGRGSSFGKHGRLSSQQRTDDPEKRHRGYCSAVSLEEWNERWRVREQVNDEPAPLLVRAAGALPAGRALDLACGGGRNAVWLSNRGWDVVAIDGSTEAIRIVQQLDPRIDARVLDLESGAPLPFDDGSFDLVAILFYLHRPLFPDAIRLLRPGGTIVCAVRTRGRYRIAPGELVRTFADFEIVHAAEGEIAELIATRR